MIFCLEYRIFNLAIYCSIQNFYKWGAKSYQSKQANISSRKIFNSSFCLNRSIKRQIYVQFWHKNHVITHLSKSNICEKLSALAIAYYVMWKAYLFHAIILLLFWNINFLDLICNYNIAAKNLKKKVFKIVNHKYKLKKRYFIGPVDVLGFLTC